MDSVHQPALCKCCDNLMTVIDKGYISKSQILAVVEEMRVGNDFADDDAKKAQNPRIAEMLGRQAGRNSALSSLLSKLNLTDSNK